MSRNRRTARTTSSDLVNLTEALSKNGRAVLEGPKKKKWTIHDLKQIKPLNDAQENMFHSFFEGKHVCAHGSAGTGKSYIACFLALNELLRSDTPIQKIIIVRSAVQTREIGHLPGTVEEKIALYELPFHDIFHDLLGRRSSYDDLKDAGWVEFNTSSFVRGLTWDNAVVVVDEAQNMTWQELDSVITRLGQHSRLIVCGDALYQQDLPKREQSGFRGAISVMEKMKCFGIIGFSHNDIVRSAFAREWIIARDNLAL